MGFNTYGLVYSASLFAGLLGGVKLGHLFGKRRRTSAQETDKCGTLDSVVFALIGLLLAFSFSGAISNYGSHRDLLTKEAHHIADFHQKLDFLPEEMRTPLRASLREYANMRLAATQAEIHSSAEQEALAASQQIQKQIWKDLVAYVKNFNNVTVSNQLLPAFSIMVSDPDAQLADAHNHVPIVVYGLIFILATMASFLAGYGMPSLAKIPVIRVIIFSLSVSVTVYTVIDLEFPRTGFFNASPANTMLIKTIKDMP